MGGNGEYERENSEIPYIQFFPSYDEEPSHVPGEQDDIVLNDVGVVTEIRNLFLASGLVALCCEFQPVETLDLSDCVNLLTLEAYFSSIKMTNSQECLSLRRCCLESTGAQYSWKIEGGARGLKARFWICGTVPTSGI